jgi:hypothetical protein
VFFYVFTFLGFEGRNSFFTTDDTRVPALLGYRYKAPGRLLDKGCSVTSRHTESSWFFTLTAERTERGRIGRPDIRSQLSKRRLIGEAPRIVVVYVRCAYK